MKRIGDPAEPEATNPVRWDGEPSLEFAALLAKAWDDNARKDGVDYVSDVSIALAGNAAGCHEDRKLPRDAKIARLARLAVIPVGHHRRNMPSVPTSPSAIEIQRVDQPCALRMRSVTQTGTSPASREYMSSSARRLSAVGCGIHSGTSELENCDL
ncbi:hypothetical protein APR11_001592 [Nocardia amikacinitolerans]|nr:hypothetical protein [Nocardia amikacinitolerans]